MPIEFSSETTHAAQRHIETYVRSLFAIHNLPAPGGDQLGQLVHAGMGLLGPEARRSPDRIGPAVIGQLDGLVLASAEVGRVRNLYGAEAARAAQAAGGANGTRGAGFGYIDALRAGSSARYRDLAAREGSDGGKGGNAGGGTIVSGGVPVEFARSFAGTGMVGGTLRTFAEVGLDRGTFNEFRREGFSKEQIVDSARDSKVLGWKGKEDLSIAQHASTRVRKAAVATDQATTPEERAKRLARERELEQQNEARPDSDPQKRHDRRFFERRHQDHLRHDAKAGLGSAALEQGTAIPSRKNEPASASRRTQDRQMAKSEKQKTAVLSSNADDLLGSSKPTAAPNKLSPVKVAIAKAAAPGQG